MDWLGRYAEAQTCFSKAEQLDPNNYYTVANVGLHYIELGDYAAARPWLVRSLYLGGQSNSIPLSYLRIAEGKLLEAATNEFRAKLDSPMH
jgi:Flp pilus assembly protein TadD